MAALLPWPFLDGGAAAVSVATVFDGATIAHALVWRGGGGEARDADGHVLVRRAADGSGFELVLRRACDGVVDGGARVVALRELSQCGVQAVPIGPFTRITMGDGAVTYVVAATRPPAKLPPPSRRRGWLAFGVPALVWMAFGVTLQATAPRRPRWNVADSVRVKVSMMLPSLPGGRAPSSVVERKVAPPARTAPQKATAEPQPQKRKQVVPNRERATTSREDAKKVAALLARASGAVGVMAQMRAAFLGDAHVATSDVFDQGSQSLGENGGDAHGGGSSDRSGDGSGDEYGAGGLGLTGVGEGGGGSGDTIGLGDIGTIGDGSGLGTGYGYGSGVGRLGGRRATVPDVILARAQVSGACDGALIRRVMRAHLNEIRFCYERVLQSRPELDGRTVARFALERGRVAAATANGFIEVDGCVAGAIQRWEFPTCTGLVSWPIQFIRSAP